MSDPQNSYLLNFQPSLRPNTERPITIAQGTNLLCDADTLEENVSQILCEGAFKRNPPELWDGQTAERVVDSIQSRLNIG